MSDIHKTSQKHGTLHKYYKTNQYGQISIFKMAPEF